ncbi:uncharacterized protein EI97DRAFT_431782 [Westerdykella ornata]|uniref:Uncharacterized protein n=1 Tax=Westerdykella ornata TaxID=318751 RepID=A0A6A6JQP9_WESOR|nr:uncharacterized protein EI97DRAFT_431782 [Westerdykella ornata]KAF2278564.1 hypothetical protein EI97DRAFT_431782 [Westerdykella ornata]
MSSTQSTTPHTTSNSHQATRSISTQTQTIHDTSNSQTDGQQIRITSTETTIKAGDQDGVTASVSRSPNRVPVPSTLLSCAAVDRCEGNSGWCGFAEVEEAAEL